MIKNRRFEREIEYLISQSREDRVELAFRFASYLTFSYVHPYVENIIFSQNGDQNVDQNHRPDGLLCVIRCEGNSYVSMVIMEAVKYLIAFSDS